MTQQFLIKRKHIKNAPVKQIDEKNELVTKEYIQSKYILSKFKNSANINQNSIKVGVMVAWEIGTWKEPVE